MPYANYTEKRVRCVAYRIGERVVSQVITRPLPAPAFVGADSSRRETDSPSLRVRQNLTPFPELDCVRHLLPVGIIAEAERRAREVGVGADRALISAGAISEHDYVAALARHLGIPFQTFDEMPRENCAFNDERLLSAPAFGMLPLWGSDDPKDPTVLVAPRKFYARQLCTRSRSGELPPRLGLMTNSGLQGFVDRHCVASIGHRASAQLREEHPQFSAAHSDRRMRWVAGGAGTLIVAGAVAIPFVTHLVAAAFFSLLFVAWTALRLLALTRQPTAPRLTTPHPYDLPDYTIIVALYREAAVVARLTTALNSLRYPREKLDIKLVVEEDDLETRAAIASLALDARYQIVIAPNTGPRTKPKALNAALPFARGAFTAIYDAEDRPDADQLLSALECFWRGGEKLACVQGRLTIDNTSDNWLTKLFTAEYCGLFDVFLPALAAWRLPLPLGGSSNHFRTAALREVGGRDPYNVTEDADLGMRLARRGFDTAVIASTTYEEAPSRLEPWLKQRSRWFKGWFQTWAVHMRTPRALYRQLGLTGFIVFQLLVGGTALAALVHPLFAVAMIYHMASDLPDITYSLAQLTLALLHSTAFIAGYLASTALALVGLARRNLLQHASVLVLMPILWGLLSLAAWRGLIQLLRDPYRWEKTEHGLARTSRQAGDD